MPRRRSTRSSARPARPGGTREAIAATAADQLRAVDGLTGQIRQVAASSARTLTRDRGPRRPRRGAAGGQADLERAIRELGDVAADLQRIAQALRGGDLTVVAAAERAYVALGSNLGDRAGHLAAAREALARSRKPRSSPHRRRGDGPARGHGPAALSQPDGAAGDRGSIPAAAARGLPGDRARARAASAASGGAPGRSTWTSCGTGSGA